MEAPHRARQKSKARRLRKPGYVPHRALTTRIKPSGSDLPVGVTLLGVTVSVYQVRELKGYITPATQHPLTKD